mgnify:CR=1 FL=1
MKTRLGQDNPFAVAAFTLPAVLLFLSFVVLPMLRGGSRRRGLHLRRRVLGHRRELQHHRLRLVIGQRVELVLEGAEARLGVELRLGAHLASREPALVEPPPEGFRGEPVDDDEDELGDMFAKRKCFAHGRNGQASAQKDMMASVLKGVDLATADRRIEEWMERLALKTPEKDWGSAKVDELSRGMQQKVQFIGTLLHDPDLVILDEPFSGLDPINAQALKDTVIDLKRRAKTIIFSTHMMDNAERMCDAVCIIARGEKVLDGPVSEIRGGHGEGHVAVALAAVTLLVVLTTDAELAFGAAEPVGAPDPVQVPAESGLEPGGDHGPVAPDGVHDRVAGAGVGEQQLLGEERGEPGRRGAGGQFGHRVHQPLVVVATPVAAAVNSEGASSTVMSR